MPNNSTNRVVYTKFLRKDIPKVERYDKLIEHVSMKVKKEFNKTRSKTKDSTNKRIFVPSRMMNGKSIIKSGYTKHNTRAVSLKALKGNTAILSLNSPAELGKHSLYKD